MSCTKQDLRKQRDDLLKACKGLLKIAKIAMPDSYFASDSRVKRAQNAIAKAKPNLR